MVLSHRARKHPPGKRNSKTKKEAELRARSPSYNGFLKRGTLLQGDAVYFKNMALLHEKSAKCSMSELDSTNSMWKFNL